MSSNRVLVFIIVLYEARMVLAAETPPCLTEWQTPRNDGAISGATDSGVELGVKCLPNIPNACAGGPNARCVFSFRTFSYICCHDVWLESALAILSNKNDSKPRCPNGGIPLDGNQAVTCDPTKPSSCKDQFTCIRAANATGTSWLHPYLCCKTSTLTSFEKVFYDLGFTPTLVPIAPTDPINSITFDSGVDTANALVVNQGDDWSESMVKVKFDGTLYPTFVSTDIAQVSGDKYHLLIFDAVNNKHVLLFQTDITGGAATDTRLALSTGNKLIVYPWNFRNATYPSGFQWDNSYAFGPASYPLKYSTPQKYIALLFTTGTTAIASLGIDVTTATGAFGPNQGALLNSTITDFLRGEGAKLGAPIAGTYFLI